MSVAMEGQENWIGNEHQDVLAKNMLKNLKEEAAQVVSKCIDLESSQVARLLETPKDPSHGQLSLPVFFLAKELRQAPAQIAKDLADKANQELSDQAKQGSVRIQPIEKVEALSGFVNFHFRAAYLQQVVSQSLLQAAEEQIGASGRGKGKRIVIDYSSPNVAKPMSIGHLRATVIGQAICNLARSQGFEVLGLNHLGDWGVQFGKLAWAYQNWGQEYDFKEKPFESLYAIYVRFHAEAETNKELEEEGAKTFKRLEDGDEEVLALWKWFVEISMKEYQRLWDLLGVKHDLVKGESFYNDRLKPTEKLLEEKGLLEESDGAMVVRLDEENIPPCLIRKSDGASLYATRDLASAIYRMEELKADMNLYVVGVDQSLHFKQVFKVLDKMGYSWAKDCHHISFGMYRFKDQGKMSTRRGNVIFLEDVLNKAVELVQKIIEEKNPQLPNKNEVAKQVGIGAIVFNDLFYDRVRNVDFDWERVVDFEGDSGPYVQYTYVRCWSLMQKYSQNIESEFKLELDSPEEKELLMFLMRYDEVLNLAFESFKPHLVANYLLDLCRCFGHFYHRHRILNASEPELVAARMSLVHATEKVLKSGLSILNMQAPRAM